MRSGLVGTVGGDARLRAGTSAVPPVVVPAGDTPFAHPRYLDAFILIGDPEWRLNCCRPPPEMFLIFPQSVGWVKNKEERFGAAGLRVDRLSRRAKR
jgi:hypothetical protein